MKRKPLIALGIILILLLLAAGPAAGASDGVAGMAFHSFTMDAGNGTCVAWIESGQATRNCDPVNLAFPGQSLAAVRAALEAQGWSATGIGTTQELHFADPDQLFSQALQMANGSWYSRYHLRLWVDPDGGGVVGAVHHESGIPHSIDRDWERAEAQVVEQLCGVTHVCSLSPALTAQLAIQDQHDQEGDTDPATWRGWANDGRVTVFSTGPANQPPQVTISAPADGATFDEGATIAFSGAAGDAEDGDLSASLAWSSDLDGFLGSGASILAELSMGSHTVTARVTDSAGQSGSASINVEVLPANQDQLDVTLSVDPGPYGNRAQVELTVMVSSNGQPVSGALVTLTITTPKGRTRTETAATDASGLAALQYKTNIKRDGTGVYAVLAEATAAGYTPATASAIFSAE